MDRFSKVRKMKYTYTHIHTHGSWSYFVADVLKMFFSVKKKLKENIFFTSLEGENRIIFYSEAQKHSILASIFFTSTFRLSLLENTFIISKEYFDKEN